MLYVKDSNILTIRQLLKLVKVARAEHPRQQDLDDWGAFELQPDNQPDGDVVTAFQTASVAQDGLWYRDYDVREFTPEELDDYQSNAVRSVNDHYNNLVNSLADDYPDYEKETWPNQESEARAWVVAQVTPTPVIDIIIAANGSTKEDHCSHVISKADAYRAMAADYVGKRHVTVAAIRAATSRKEIDDIVASVLAP